MPDANVLCTFTNESAKAVVTLKKAWVKAFAGDTAKLNIAGGASATATSTATEGDSIDNTNVASANVRLGASVTLSETLPAADVPNDGTYTSTWACDDGTFGPGRTIPAFKVTKSVTCTITNTADEIDITVSKRWITAFEGDSAELSIDATGPAVDGDSVATGVLNQLHSDVVTTTVRVGDGVTIAEVLGLDNQGATRRRTTAAPSRTVRRGASRSPPLRPT